jgi:uncharacterized protein YdeI (YjbR/CyaY-like superfamily)
MARDPRIDDYIAKAAPFAQPILSHLRALVHKAVPGLDETLKWGMPHFTLNGKNLAGIAAFKAHAAFMIHGDGRQGEGMGQFGKLTQLADLPGDDELKAKLLAAKQQLESGTKRPRPKPAERAEIPMQEDLAAALSSKARSFFDRLAPSRRYEYLEWITGAKRPETRAKRIAQAADLLAEGKNLNWKYERR